VCMRGVACVGCACVLCACVWCACVWCSTLTLYCSYRVHSLYTVAIQYTHFILGNIGEHALRHHSCTLHPWYLEASDAVGEVLGGLRDDLVLCTKLPIGTDTDHCWHTYMCICAWVIMCVCVCVLCVCMYVCMCAYMWCAYVWCVCVWCACVWSMCEERWYSSVKLLK